MKKKDIENSKFICVNCGLQVKPLFNGSFRNHCPKCLHSVHLDLIKPGDRASDCHGIMKPIEVLFNGNKGYQIKFQCQECNHVTRNKAALDDPIQPDNLDELINLNNVRMKYNNENSFFVSRR